ncbi:hypothetical protein D3C73_1366840 [compost metagenome]
MCVFKGLILFLARMNAEKVNVVNPALGNGLFKGLGADNPAMVIGIARGQYCCDGPRVVGLHHTVDNLVVAAISADGNHKNIAAL